MPNLTEQSPIDRGRTNYEQILPIHLNVSHFDSSLYSRPGRLKDFVNNYMQDSNGQEIFDLQKKTCSVCTCIITLQKFTFYQNGKYLYIYFFYNFNDHDNTSYLLVL